jgi:tetratricopeptide (TPR) repeat protein/cellulose biosynthesis protein BcsQ
MDARRDLPVDEPLGNIITFYSYKGGTGRSMALANIAWILASNGKRVLAVDWDLEAPGLHRYFAPFLSDKDLTGAEGLIDLLIEFRDATAVGVAGDDKWHEAYADISPYVISLDWDFPRKGTLDILPAGRQGASYSARVNSFDWVEFYERRGGGVFLETIKEKMRADYDYVLIDSRTGVSDTSGICTVQMPDAVVVCFTLNNQGIQGSAAVSHSIYEQRLRKGRDIAIFPVPMRVEPFEKAKLDTRRDYAKKMFEVFPAHLSPQSRAQFQEDTQVKYLPYYAYEEILATFGNKPGESESTSLLAPAERLAAYLTDYLDGETISRMEASEYLESRRQSILALFEGQQATADPRQLLILSADATFAGLKPEDENVARRALLRMVRLADAGEQGGDSRLLLRLSKFDRATEIVLRNLATTPLLTIERDAEPGEALVQLASDDLLRHWPRLQSWIQEDREFLLWRQKLNAAVAEWRRLNEDSGALLTGAPLDVAKQWRTGRSEDLNENETEYIDRGLYEEERRRREHIAREEREKQYAAERTELQQQTEVLIKTTQQSQRRSRLGALIAYAVALIVLGAIIWWQYNLQAKAPDIKEDITKAATTVTDGDREVGQKNFDKALTIFQEAMSIAPSYAPAYYSRGRANLEMKRLDTAAADFNKAISLNPNYEEAYVGIGDVYWKKRDLDNALTSYNRAIAINPNLANAYIHRGKVFAERRNMDQALADYNRAIELSKDNPSAFLWRGDAYSATGDYDRALADFWQALRLDPDLSEAHIKRADALMKRNGPGDGERAVAEYNTGLQEPSYDPAPYLNRGKAYVKTRNSKEAGIDFDRVIKLSQDKPEYSKIKDEALAQLQEIQPNIAQMPNDLNGRYNFTANPTTIYLQYRDTKDAQILNRIAAILKRGEKEGKYTVADKIELVTQATTGDVRYFHQEDAEIAAKIKQIVETALNFSRIELPIELKPMLSWGNRAPQGWIEVWLPSLPQPAFRPERRRGPTQSMSEETRQRYSKN